MRSIEKCAFSLSYGDSRDRDDPPPVKTNSNNIVLNAILRNVAFWMLAISAIEKTSLKKDYFLANIACPQV